MFTNGEGNGNPPQYSCLENPTDRGAWLVTVHGVAKSQTRLSTRHIFAKFTGLLQNANIWHFTMVYSWFSLWRLYVCSVAQSCLILGDLWSVTYQAPCPWNSPGKNTGVGCHFLLWGIILTQESNLCFLHLLHWQMDFFTWELMTKNYNQYM